MNSLNYGSREACERLFKAGIVLETEHWHGWDGRIYRKDEVPYGTARVPAPSMAEVWRELPVYFEVDMCFQPNLVKVADDTIGVMYSAFYSKINNERPVPACYQSTNPTDTLIYLRIWLEERKEKSHVRSK